MKAWFGLLLATGVATSLPVNAAGVAPGTNITLTATMDYTVGGVNFSTSASNTITVDELIDVTLTWQDGGAVQVLPSATDQGLLFRISNNGNGSESYTVTANVSLPGNNFNPTNQRIYFDTDASGDFSVGDVLYVPGSNDPNLASGASVDMLIVSDIPAAIANGKLADAKLTATSKTFTGQAGDFRAGLGDGGVGALLDSTGGKASDKGIYQVGNSPFTFTKSAKVTDPQGGNQPVSGAVITYTLRTKPTGISAVNSALVTDTIPVNTTYVPNSLTLNGTALSDVADSDPGDENVTTPGAITVDLGALAANAGAQLITFQVKIN
jgi:uncharacterized repeat protein (TIGR01451 family)